jgi:hypothetical protein
MPLEIPSEPVPIPARLVERALDLARAEVGLALVHTRRIAVRAVSALLATIVACAFAQLTVVLVVAWPVLAEHVPVPNLLAGVGVSVLLAAAGGVSAFLVWSGAQEKKPAHSIVPAASTSPSVPPVGAVTSGAATSPAAAALGKGQSTTPASVPPGPISGTDPARNVVVSRQRRFDTREEPAGATLAERVGS